MGQNYKKGNDFMQQNTWVLLVNFSLSFLLNACIVSFHAETKQAR